MKHIILAAAISLFCGTLNGFAQNTAKVQNVPGGTMVTYDNLSWSIPSDFYLADSGPEGDHAYVLTIENFFEDYVSLYIYPVVDPSPDETPLDTWDLLVAYLEFSLDDLEEDCIMGQAYDKCETVIQAAGQEYSVKRGNVEEFFYVEYAIAGKYGIYAESAAWEKDVLDKMKTILHSINVK